MSIAKFTITYYHKKYEDSNDIDKRCQRTAIVYAQNLPEAIQKVKEFDDEYLAVAENGVAISERQWDEKRKSS